MIWLILGLSALSAVFYRWGGQGKPFNTKHRDIGCSLVNIATCLCLGLNNGLWATVGAYFLMFGLSWATYASYWGLDEQKWGYWAHGLGISLAALPIAFITGHWLGFAIRTVILTAFITLWSEWTSKDWLEEGGRGLAANLSLWLLIF